MALSNAERQRRHRERLKARATAAAPMPNLHDALLDLCQSCDPDQGGPPEELVAEAMVGLGERLREWANLYFSLDGSREDERARAVEDALNLIVRVPSLGEIQQRAEEGRKRRRALRNAERRASATVP